MPTPVESALLICLSIAYEILYTGYYLLFKCFTIFLSGLICVAVISLFLFFLIDSFVKYCLVL